MSVAVAIGCLAVISYGLRVSGLLVREDHPFLQRYATTLTAGILASLIVSNTVTAGKELVVDARLIGLGVAAAATIARLPLALTLALAVGSTAIVRLVI